MSDTIFSSAVLRRLGFSPQTLLATIPNSTGTWTNTGFKFCPHTKADLRRIVAPIQADYKTGTGSMLAGIPGRKSASGSVSCPFIPSGAAGTKPDLDLLLQNIFGVGATVVSSTSVTYNQADGASIPFCAAIFNESGGGTSQFGYGGTVGNFTLNVGGDGYMAIDADFALLWLLETDNYANEDAAGKGGVTVAFPADPGSPAIAGAIVPSFVSTSISIGGNSLVELVSAQVSGDTGRRIRMDGGVYGTAVVQGRRGVSLKSLKFADSAGANLATLKNLAASKAATDVVIVQGAGAGLIVTTTLKSVQFDNFSYSENGAGLDVDFSDSPAHASAVGSVNDIKIALT
jgi:hypothetical protein